MSARNEAASTRRVRFIVISPSVADLGPHVELPGVSYLVWQARHGGGNGSAACAALLLPRIAPPGYFIGLLAGFDLGRDETHFIHAGGIAFIDDLGYVGEGEIFIPLYERNL